MTIKAQVTGTETMERTPPAKFCRKSSDSSILWRVQLLRLVFAVFSTTNFPRRRWMGCSNAPASTSAPYLKQ